MISFFLCDDLVMKLPHATTTKGVDMTIIINSLIKSIETTKIEKSSIETIMCEGKRIEIIEHTLRNPV